MSRPKPVILLGAALLVVGAGLGLAVVGCGPDTPGPDPAGGDARPGASEAERALVAARADLVGREAPGASAFPALNDVRRAIQAGQPDAALELLAREGAGSPAEAAYLAAMVDYRQGRYARAVPSFVRALGPGPDYPERWLAPFHLARCLDETGDRAGARAGYELDLELSDGSDASFRLGLLDFDDGDLEGAEAHLREALARFTRPRDRAKTHARLGDVFHARGDAAAAREAYERCVRDLPHPEVLYKLVQVCRELGDEDAARAYEEQHRQAQQASGGGR